MLMPLHARNVEISYFQSDSNSKIEWVVVDDCAVQIEKAKMRDECYVLKKVNDFCHLDLDLKECK
jgi:hypothetical protein